MNTMKLVSIASLLSLATACSFYKDDKEPPPNFPPSLPLSGQTYVVNQILLGEDAADVIEFAFDIDGDGQRDNNLGQSIRLAYSYLDRESQADLDDAVASGEMMHLILLGSPDSEFLDTARVFLGQDIDADPDNNLTGAGELAVRAGSRVDGALFGSFAGDSFAYALGDITLENTLFGAVELPLELAQMQGTVLADGSLIGTVGGGISQENVDDQLAPALARSIQADSTDCPLTGEQFPDCCEPGSKGDSLIRLFDSNSDCSLTVEEVQEHGLFRSLLSPDIDLNGDDVDDAISVAFGFTAVPATFDIP